MTQTAQLAPFESVSRFHRKQMPVQPVLDSQSVGDRIKKLGYAGRLQLNVFLKIQLNAPASYVRDAVYAGARALIKRVTFGTSQAALLVNADAWSLHLLSYVDTGLNFDTSRTTHDTSLSPLAAGLNYVQFRVDLPIAYNQDLNYDLGLVNVQNDDVTWEWNVDFGSFGSLIDDANKVTNVDGFILPILHHYDGVGPGVAMPELGHVVKISTDTQNIVTQNGTHVLDLPRGNAYAQLLHFVTNGGVPATVQVPYTNPGGNLLNYGLWMQDSTVDEQLPVWFLMEEQRKRYGQPLPAGVIVMDNTYDTGFPGRFQTGMQILDTSDFTELQVKLDVQNMNPGNSKILTVRREIVTLPVAR